jgi:hypothetical protein
MVESAYSKVVNTITKNNPIFELFLSKERVYSYENFHDLHRFTLI